MSIRLASLTLIPVVLVAGVLALQGVDRVPDATAATSPEISSPRAERVAVPLEEGEMLPTDHPPMGATTSSYTSLLPSARDTSALAWKMPPVWQEAPSPNAMRLATYRAPGGVEISVARAGGTTEANIQRWIAQFDDVGREGRAEKTVHGLRVVTIDVAGTYVGGGITMAGPAEPSHDWAMVGAVVESRSPSYFFKMTGPAVAVHASRSAFDRLIDSVSPR